MICNIQTANMRLISKWTSQVDEDLKFLGKSQRKKNWVHIANQLKLKYGNDNFTGKQCRERFINHCLSNSEKFVEISWSKQEFRLLLKLFEIEGPKWTKIACDLNGKSENNVKNKFYSSLRKFVRKLNNGVKKYSKKYKKELKYGSVLRVIEAQQFLNEANQSLVLKSNEIKKIAMEYMAIEQFQNIEGQKVVELVDQINKFNLQTRSFKYRGNKKSGSEITKLKIQQKNVVIQMMENEREQEDLACSNSILDGDIQKIRQYQYQIDSLIEKGVQVRQVGEQMNKCLGDSNNLNIVSLGDSNNLNIVSCLKYYEQGSKNYNWDCNDDGNQDLLKNFDNSTPLCYFHAV